LDLKNPVLTVKDARHVTCTAGSWPCYVVTHKGELFVYGGPEKRAALTDGRLTRLQDAISLTAHPLGGSLLIVRPAFITWLAIDTRYSITYHSDIPVPAPGLDHYDRYEVKWGPKPENILLARNVFETDKFDRFTIDAINGRTGKSTEIYKHEAFTFIPTWHFETARQGTRFIISGDRGLLTAAIRNYIKVIDIAWREESSDSTAAVTREYNLDVRCRFDPTKFSNVELATISPNGNYVVTLRALYAKTPHTTSHSVLEQWDLLAMDQQRQNVEPVAVELKTGTAKAPILRLAYSEDSSRMLAWDSNGTINIFRLSPQLPDRFNQTLRMPSEWSSVSTEGSATEFTNVPLSETIKNRYKKWLSH
jgi:hypothetical protein